VGAQVGSNQKAWRHRNGDYATSNVVFETGKQAVFMFWTQTVVRKSMVVRYPRPSSPFTVAAQQGLGWY
jgi:hypothetical protein